MWFDQRIMEGQVKRRTACVLFTQGGPGHSGTARGGTKSSSLYVPPGPGHTENVCGMAVRILWEGSLGVWVAVRFLRGLVHRLQMD